MEDHSRIELGVVAFPEIITSLANRRKLTTLAYPGEMQE